VRSQTLNLVHPQESNRQQLQSYFWTLKKQAIEGTRIRQLCIDVRTDWSIMYLNTAAGCFWPLSDSKDAPMYMMYAELLLWYCNYTGRCRCHLMSTCPSLSEQGPCILQRNRPLRHVHASVIPVRPSVAHLEGNMFPSHPVRLEVPHLPMV